MVAQAAQIDVLMVLAEQIVQIAQLLKDAMIFLSLTDAKVADALQVQLLAKMTSFKPAPVELPFVKMVSADLHASPTTDAHLANHFYAQMATVQLISENALVNLLVAMICLSDALTVLVLLTSLIVNVLFVHLNLLTSRFLFRHSAVKQSISFIRMIHSSLMPPSPFPLEPST